MSSPTPRTALLDVNVLIALAWPNHVGHEAAQAWFHATAKGGWATTPVTEAGFVRVSSSRRALPTATTPHLAIDMLLRMTALDGHVFWADTVQNVVGEAVDASILSGHRQVTDAHLLALCIEHKGRLITFDRGITGLTRDADTLVEVLE